MVLIIDQKTEPQYKFGRSFYKNTKATALREAQKHATKEGHVASLPQLVRGRKIAPFDNEIWNNWFTALSEEDVGLTNQGNRVLAVSHGCGVFTLPERIKQAKKEGLINYTGRISDQEFQGILEGKIRDESQVPVYSLNEFKKAGELPSSYTVVVDLKTAIKTKSDYHKISNLRKNPLFIVRAGGEAQANAYLDKAAEKWNTKRYGNYFMFNNPITPSGRLLFLGDFGYFGFCGNLLLGDCGRFVAVAPEAQSLDTPEKSGIIAPTLEEVLVILKNSKSIHEASAKLRDLSKK